MKSFPYFEFIVFIMPGGYFLCLLIIILNLHGLGDLIAMNGMSSSLEILFVVTLSMIIGHVLGIVANAIEGKIWRNKPRNNIVKLGEKLIPHIEEESEIFKYWESLYYKLEGQNKLDTITKLYAQARFAQNILVANLSILIIHVSILFIQKPKLNYVPDNKVAILIILLIICSLFCLKLFIDRDRHKVYKVYVLGEK